MTANLFGERFAGYRVPAWHKKGTVFTDEISAIEAIRLAKCDYAVFKSPVSAEIHNTWMPGDNNSNSGTIPVEIPDRFAITREPTADDGQFRFFGFVSNDYEILDNEQIASALDVLTDKWRVDTVGALDEGRVLFVALDAGEIELVKGGNEIIHNYFVFTDRKDGRQKARFMFTPVRVVCQNTLTMGERRATVSAEIEHRQGATDALMLRVDVVDKLIKKQEVSIENLQRLASVKLTNEQASKIIEAAYPFPKKSPDLVFADFDATLNATGSSSLADELFKVANDKKRIYDYRHEQAATYRDAAMTLFNQINDEHPVIANTPWAAYNAVVEFADWRDGRGDIEYSALFGTRAKEKVMAFAQAERVAARASK